MQRQPSATQLDKMISRPSWRQCRTKRRCLGRNSGEGRVRLFHLFRRQGEPLEGDIIKVQVRMAIHLSHHCKKVEPSAKTRFRDGQMV
ncbi:MAG: Uncharacterised protein [SAR116 cluster bacterium]|nr:MAG: Uncharacterised protein [SAR116 cluster bacterium]